MRNKKLHTNTGYTIAKKVNRFALLSIGFLGTTMYTSAQTVTGSGTNNYISKWTTTGSTIGNSLLYDNGTNLGIGTNSPGFNLDVNGSINTSGSYYINGFNTFTVFTLPYNYYIANGSISINKPTGGYNLFIGSGSGGSTTSGSYNTSTGLWSLLSNSTGSSNTAVGLEALTSNTSGSYNTAIGVYALLVNQSSSYNSAFGYACLYSNTTGYYNTATGYQALYTNNSGSFNTAYGYNALYSNNNANDNSAFGYNSLSVNNTGTQNSAFGELSLADNTTGAYNTAVGTDALAENTTGFSNTALGCYSNVNSNNLSNATAIGYQATVTASNHIVIGNGSITSIGGYAPGGWATLSDKRFKKNVKEDVHGLDFIMKLKPITYNLDVKKLNTFLGVDERKEKDRKSSRLSADEQAKIDAADEQAVKEREAIRESGFLAQEVEQAAQDVKYDFNGVIKPASDKDHYSLSYAEFVVPLVKGMQEQQQQIDSLKKLVLALTSSGQSVPTSNINSFSINLSDKNVVVLNQNVPNPFADKTVITYNIPQNAGTAQIVFYDQQGQQIRSMDVTTRGIGQMTVYGNDLANGIYTYALIIDGKVSDTKRMVKTN